MNNSLAFFLSALVLASVTGCSGGASTANGSSSGDKSCALGAEGALAGDGEVAGCQGDDALRSPAESAGLGSASGGGSGLAEAGVLTAGAWDDNKNFDRFLAYRASTIAKTNGWLPIEEAEHRAAHAALAQVGPKQRLDVSLVIDTTGSMGDEIAYLQKEFLALSQTINAKYPGADQRWSLVLYKDTEDPYVVKWFDFRNDASEFRAKLGEASASGGGDFPEASDQGIDAATRLSWRPDADVAKLAFWVADAPHHVGTETRLASGIRRARDKGIHLYPVASSGVDEQTELSMRSSAQLTGGRYLFLTDDSGVGGAHKEASVPCYFVTKLDKAILRMVDIELTGTYREPDTADVLRTGGDPQNGACQLGAERLLAY